MNVLLLSMPDSFEHMPPVAIRMPNGALGSLAANVDSHHHVAIADLILARTAVRSTVERLVSQYAPDLVGLSVMTFQRATALQVARLVKMVKPSARIVVGGYDPSLAPDAYEASLDIDFVVRGEGEQTLAELLRAIEGATTPSAIRNPQSAIHNILGLSYRDGAGFVHNAPRPVMPLATEKLRLPNRGVRVLDGYTLLGRQIDVVETSRGCTFDCSFCSIIEMRGRNFHPFPIDRVIADIADAHGRGARAIFLVDDNITLDVHRFETLCHALIDANFSDMEYFVQAMTAPLAQHGATLAPVMRRAGFRYVFLGIENVLDDDLTFLRARAKNARRERGRTIGNASIEAIGHLRRNGMYVVGGLIVGNPDDTRESIEANLEFARRYVDWPYIQHPTPYPRTPMTSEFRSRGLSPRRACAAPPLSPGTACRCSPTRSRGAVGGIFWGWKTSARCSADSATCVGASAPAACRSAPTRLGRCRAAGPPACQRSFRTPSDELSSLSEMISLGGGGHLLTNRCPTARQERAAGSRHNSNPPCGHVLVVPGCIVIL